MNVIVVEFRRRKGSNEGVEHRGMEGKTSKQQQRKSDMMMKRERVMVRHSSEGNQEKRDMR